MSPDALLTLRPHPLEDPQVGSVTLAAGLLYRIWVVLRSSSDDSQYLPQGPINAAFRVVPPLLRRSRRRRMPELLPVL